MPSSVKWSKDTPESVRELAALVRQLSLEEAKLRLRLLVLEDIASFVKLHYGKQGQAMTCKTMLTTLEMFGCFAIEGFRICRAVSQGSDATPLLKTFVSNCSRFGGRGGEPLMQCDAIFAGAPDLLLMYLQRGLVDLTTCWSGLPPGSRYAFVRAVLDIDKIYSNTIGASEDLLFSGGKTSIQRWRPGSELTMDDVLKRWLSLESNDSIYTGMAFNSGHRRTNGEQLADYRAQSATPQGYHCCWAAIVNAVVIAKDIAPSNHKMIISLFAQNVPAIACAFRPAVAEPDVRNFVENYLPILLKNPEPPPLQQTIVSGTVLRLKPSDLNKLKELQMLEIARLGRAKEAAERDPLIKSLLEGKVFTRRLNDEQMVFEGYDENTGEFVFRPK